MVVTLAKGTNNVKVIPSNPESKIAQLLKIEKPAGTDRKEEESLLLRINLPSGREREVKVRWIDTPGEAWSKTEWRESQPDVYKDLLRSLGQSQAVLLLLPPYRYQTRSQDLDNQDDTAEFLDPDTWKAEISERLALLREHCPRVQHILISIHKADLFYNLDDEENRWQYDPDRSFRWAEHDRHIRETYFFLAEDIIRDHNSHPPYLSPKFFVTTIHRPTLLELPWIYLGAYLANA
ncbi:hypothetical protein V0288_04780 [Pannus brasiliensis CCIBt3594]|uniref:Uncharacterized protein n=1 Tax=Pannus brasiliensis CCIBt3594 TaxID=1427578 RepID=A0AAW9QS07_9CHRO